MDEKEIKKRVEPYVDIAIKILKAITNRFNAPETNMFYKLFFKDELIDHNNNKGDEKR